MRDSRARGYAFMKGREMEFCDLECAHAEFPREDAVDGSRSCRTFVALYCRGRKVYVHKNLPCAEKVTREQPPAPKARKGGTRKKAK
jgi:hypothetical protein